MSAVSAQLSSLGIQHRFILSGKQQQLILLYERDRESVQEVIALWEQGGLDDHKGVAPVKKPRGSIKISQKPAPLTLAVVFLGFVGAALTGFGWQFIHPFTFWDFSQLPVSRPTDFSPWVDIASGELWRLITPVFLHFGAIHIIFNALWIWYLLAMVELHQGRFLAMGLALVIGIVSNSAQAMVSDGVIFGGLSGIVHGLFAYCWLWGRMHAGSAVRLPNVLFILITALMLLSPTGIFDILVGSDIADMAHISGYVSGILCALTLSFFHLKSRTDVEPR